MASIDYILDYFNRSKAHYTYDQHIKLYVNEAIYDEVYNKCYDISTGRKRAHVAAQLSKMYFLISFLVKSGHSNFDWRFLQSIVRKNNDLYCYRDILEKLGLISFKEQFIKYFSRSAGSFHYLQKSSTYSIHEGSKFSLEKNDKEIDYFFRDIVFFNEMKSILKKYSKDSSSSINNLYQQSPPPIYKDVTFSLGDIDRQHFTSKKALELYSSLEYRFNGILIESETKKLHDSVASIKGGRVYHYFHSIDKLSRESCLYLEGEPIAEAYDVHNCYCTMLYCLLDGTVSNSEKEHFYNIAINGVIYEDVVNYVNHKINGNWNRDISKTAVNSFMNLTNNKLDRARAAIENGKTSVNVYAYWVDEYFRENFPTIREYIRKHDFKERLQKCYEAETAIMINGVIRELWEKYSIKALSLHDAIYMKKTDIKLLVEKNISLQALFESYLNAYCVCK